MLGVDVFGGFNWAASNFSARPAATIGTAITPGNNTKGSWAQMLSAISNDAWALDVVFNGGDVSAAIRETIVDIGYDPAGGTSYTTLVPNLLCSCANKMINSSGLGGLGYSYYFPLRIPSGSTVAARASVNNATVGTINAWIRVYGHPTRPELCKVGSYCTAVGAVTGTSTGTAVTAGTTNEGTWTSLGTPTKSHWWWQLGYGAATTGMGARLELGDLAAGDSSNKRTILTDQIFIPNSNEWIAKPSQGAFAYVPASVEMWGRIWNSGALNTGTALVAYGVGG